MNPEAEEKRQLAALVQMMKDLADLDKPRGVPLSPKQSKEFTKLARKYKYDKDFYLEPLVYGISEKSHSTRSKKPERKPWT